MERLTRSSRRLLTTHNEQSHAEISTDKTRRPPPCSASPRECRKQRKSATERVHRGKLEMFRHPADFISNIGKQNGKFLQYSSERRMDEVRRSRRCSTGAFSFLRIFRFQVARGRCARLLDRRIAAPLRLRKKHDARTGMGVIITLT